MASDLNRCEFIGRLAADPDTRFSPNGKAVTKFRIAVGNKWKDKASGQMQEKTEWVRLVAFGKLAEICGEYLKKGSRVFVAGRFNEEKWQDQNGQDRYSVEIVLNEMTMLDARGEAPQKAQQPHHAPPQSGPEIPEWEDRDIPFN